MVLTSEDHRGRPRYDAISLVEGPRDQASGTSQIHTSTIRAVQIAIQSWRSYRSGTFSRTSQTKSKKLDGAYVLTT